MDIAEIASGTISLVTLVTVFILAVKLRSKFSELQNNMNNTEARIHDRLKRMDSQLRTQFDDGIQQTINASALCSLGLKTPVFLGDWSIDPFLARFLVNEISIKRPKVVLELGGGSSTVLIAQALKNVGATNYKHIAVDHSSEYAHYTEDLLQRAGISEMVDVWICPLQHIAEQNKSWYSNLLERLPSEPIDLLIVDGPPGVDQSKARSPAIPVLISKLAPGAIVILDDANRPDEIEICSEWKKLLVDAKFEHIHRGHGVAIFRLP